jgi:hypothetical protein
MPLLIVIVLGLFAVSAAVVVALGVTVSRAPDHEGETTRLARLGRLHSPSGKSFFPDGDSVLDLAETLDEVRSGSQRA